MLELANVDFGYNKELLFSKLNLSLANGHIYGLLGKNGAGKTTLLKNIVGLAYPRNGFSKLNGKITSDRTPEVLQNISFIAEEIYVPPLTARQFLKKTAGFYPNFNTEEFFRNLEIFDVEPDVRMDRLSYGQQKKIMITFALATNTDLLVMDEPTNGLDIPSKVQFRKIIASSLTENRIIIISTHQVRDLDNLIDAVIILHEREIVLSSKVDQIGERVSFGVIHAEDELDVLYQEEGINGQHAIVVNPGRDYGNVDLELLFNAITNNTPALLEILK
ncbi:MAG: ATP-binding cassette domain-containing protein [Daejeonella sp.]